MFRTCLESAQTWALSTNLMIIAVPTRVGLGQVNSGFAAIAATIQQVEGYYPGTVAYKNNNPGNLMYAGQPGATQGANGFAVFPSYDDGYQALLNQIQSYANQGLTIDQMMNLYAPAPSVACGAACAGNNPTLYANQIANSLGVPVGTTVADAISGGGEGLTVASTGSTTGTTGTTDDATDDGTILGMDPTAFAFLGAAAILGLYLAT
jgi:hypothetical protein